MGSSLITSYLLNFEIFAHYFVDLSAKLEACQEGKHKDFTPSSPRTATNFS